MASVTPPERDEDAMSAEELILELSECALSTEETVGFTRPDTIDEIIMMCRAYVTSLEGRTFVAQLYNKRRH